MHAPAIAGFTLAFLLATAGFASPAAAAERAAEADAATATAITAAVLDYAQRLETVTSELAETRAAIAGERTPIMDEIRAAEEKIAALEAEIARLNVEQARSQERLQAVRTEQVTLDRNLNYVASVVLDAFKSFEGNLLPGEAARLGTAPAELRQRIENEGHPGDALAALKATDLFYEQLRQRLGGHTAPGRSLRDGSNEIFEGTFAYLGPDVFFRATDGSVFGVVRNRPDSEFVVTHPLPDWDAGEAEALMTGKPSRLPADASGGKALQLRESTGSLWREIEKGGVVGYVILALGAVAVVITIMKVVDLQKLSVDSPLTVRALTGAVARGNRGEVEAALPRLRSTTRELFATGLRYLDAPRELLEEQLEGFVLRHRLVQERRLQLLAVIATAGPLLGLLGTVTGMIKTFTLITVFGTGSASRLSGGISEALVATALGLAVAIPTLVVHGFLSHRIHKGLSLLERFALEYVTAVEEARTGTRPPTSAP